MQQNIILVGPMGVGKTTIGRPLAKKLEMEFVDSDREIEDRTGVTINIIFEIEGEEGFRKRESAMISELTQRKNIVLATGGGAILDESNRILMRKHGVVVYLHASVDLQLERTRSSKNRPLLMNGDPRKILQELMTEREPLYRQEADIIVNTENRSPGAVANEIAESIVKL